MGMEKELKFLHVDHDGMRRKMSGTGVRTAAAYYERNLVFDTPDRTLKSAETLLRLRQKPGKAMLTVKQPPESDEVSALKVYQEREMEVGDFETMVGLLESVGFEVAFAYEKFREKWAFMDCVVCLDRLPFGDYAEIEGEEAEVLACAEVLGLDRATASKATYHALNLEWRADSGLPPDENFVFEAEERLRFGKKVGKH